MTEGSDGAGSEMEGDGIETESGVNEGWSAAGERRFNRKKRKKSAKEKARRGDYDSLLSNSEGEHNARLKQNDEYKVIAKLTQQGESFGEWNPLKLTKIIYNLIGEVNDVKVLQNGTLMIFCRDGAQQGKAIRLNRMGGKGVMRLMLEDKRATRGVISVIPTIVTTDEIKENVKGAKVLEVKRLKANRNGEKFDSLSVMIKFEEPVLPNKIYIGYMSYEVRPFIPPPLRCYKCQKYGHIAAVCKGKQRCGRCAGEHEYGKCEEGARLKCCNCEGEHASAYRGCEAGKKAAEVQRIRVSQGMSYAEAVKKVVTTQQDPTKIMRVESSNRSCGGCTKIKEDALIVSKNEFVLFMVEVINCSAQRRSKTEKIKIIVKAAEKYLNIKGLSWEIVKEVLHCNK